VEKRASESAGADWERGYGGGLKADRSLGTGVFLAEADISRIGAGLSIDSEKNEII
jgi:hypothetical protein